MKTEFEKTKFPTNEAGALISKHTYKENEFFKNNLERNLETISKQCSGADISKMHLLFILIALVLSSK